ncbi:putative phosphatidylserine decarboxylase [Aspergillus campestris IBT 28561]|uniref:Phosphatidylserine decarboxylase n=1 Tax=Aspergillus campestris (strain IBT 28561) TaxID=1392248 RepID=A0A2I1D6C4_ASPC2|nr:putative phosphatidylserine decarboxylase [Aspergillus campestris IBT 28561]PKY05419.1 putative phosphatidylserine decarboxylase [Aspergillus campestris IBT 28561]
MQTIIYHPTYTQSIPAGMATGSTLHSHGHWMPENMHLRRAWLSHLLDKTKAEIPPKLGASPNPVKAFQELIENDSTLYMLAISMFDEIPQKAPYDRDPTTLKKQVRSYKTMLYLFSTLLTQVPEYFLNEAEDSNIPSGLIGFPFNIILDWPMGTPSGRQFFLDPRVNTHLKEILSYWNAFLQDPNAETSDPAGGNKALIAAGWGSQKAISQLEQKANQPLRAPRRRHPQNFFNYPHWDAFFTRKFKPGIRPVDDDAAVVNACESFPLAFDTDISRRSTFWLKDAPYSLYDMLGATHDHHVKYYVNKFIGGAVYQAFLSADSYHCWNAPVTGKVMYRNVFPGTYYAETPASGFGGSSGPDPAGPDLSQRYITHIAARGVLVIDTDRKYGGAGIGLVAFVPVGMSEVSTCEWEMPGTDVGEIVAKGDVVGAFHGGGSTHCLVFERGAVERLGFNSRAEFPETATVNLGDPILGFVDQC